MGGAGGANRVYVTVGGGTGFDLREVFLDAKDINKDELTEKNTWKHCGPGDKNI